MENVIVSGTPFTFLKLNEAPGPRTVCLK